ncbi:MAG: alpha/beta hydrolase fold domain-containing protein [Caulobacterales bacterium]|nr:alpha/beta hydrolase fold domain-containing protein [Caulobacterales bacterium]
MDFARSLRALLACVLLAAPLQARAAPGDWVDRVNALPAPADGQGLPLAVAPSTQRPLDPAPREGWAGNAGQRMVYDVTQPQLIPVGGVGGCAKPCPALILVPGGGFEFLSMDNEGYEVAARLKGLGLKVFILKYRTLPLPDGFAGFQAAIASTFAGRPRPAGPPNLYADLPDAIADTEAAVRAVRAHAAEWHVDPARVGILGFSAGAVTSLGMTQANAEGARPDFVGLIYGPTHTGPVPPHAPPLFAAIAADDRFFGKEDLGLLDAWRRSGASVEFHLYSAGGHGFASRPNGTTSDAWFDQFVLWLRASKIVAPVAGKSVPPKG